MFGIKRILTLTAVLISTVCISAQDDLQSIFVEKFVNNSSKKDVTVRNLRQEAMSNLFEAVCDHMPMGQTYTNGKIAILNPNAKLQREDFLLWL